MSVALSKSGREMRTLSRSALWAYECAWCGQSLARMQQSPRNCSRICRDDLDPGCSWGEHFHPDSEVVTPASPVEGEETSDE